DERHHAAEHREHQSQQHVIAHVGFDDLPRFANPASGLRLDSHRRNKRYRRRRAQGTRTGCERLPAVGTELQIVRDLVTATVTEHAWNDSTRFGTGFEDAYVSTPPAARRGAWAAVRLGRSTFEGHVLHHGDLLAVV